MRHSYLYTISLFSCLLSHYYYYHFFSRFSIFRFGPVLHSFLLLRFTLLNSYSPHNEWKNQQSNLNWLAALNSMMMLYKCMGNFQLKNFIKRQPSDDLQIKCDWLNDSKICKRVRFHTIRIFIVNGWHLLKYTTTMQLWVQFVVK